MALVINPMLDSLFVVLEKLFSKVVFYWFKLKKNVQKKPNPDKYHNLNKMREVFLFKI
jgi:hypothetical protein